MKTTKKTTPKSKAVEPTSPIGGCASFQQALSIAELTERFIAQVKSKDTEGKNDVMRDFLKIAKLVADNYPSFDYNQFLSLTRTLSDDQGFAVEIAKLFHAWVETLITGKRLRKIHGCYSFDCYSWI